MKFQALCTIALLTVSAPLLAQQTPDQNDWKPVDAALGRSGQMQPGDVYKFAMPRKDLKVMKDGVIIAPGLALGSWAAFKKMGSETMLMGDLVLTEDEIEPVMLKLQQDGIEQTALHNHLLGETPTHHVHACRWPRGRSQIGYFSCVGAGFDQNPRRLLTSHIKPCGSPGTNDRSASCYIQADRSRHEGCRASPGLRKQGQRRHPSVRYSP